MLSFHVHKSSCTSLIGLHVQVHYSKHYNYKYIIHVMWAQVRPTAQAANPKSTPLLVRLCGPKMYIDRMKDSLYLSTAGLPQLAQYLEVLMMITLI